MKTLYVLLFLFSFTAYSAHNSLTDMPNLTIEKLVKYDFNPENSFKIEAELAQEIILNKEDLAKLKGLKIHHIDIVYTSYLGKKTFNQGAVNKQRITQLKYAFPQVEADSPTWRCIEQTGPQSNKEVKSYFHGFIVHYGPALDYEHLKTFFAPFQIAPKEFIVNAKDGGRFDCGDGTSVNIGGNTVVNSDGSPIEGDYTLTYKEYKNPADILFSGIPMTYNVGRVSQNFSSVGMYDLRAVQNGKSLKMKSPAAVDFNCTEIKKGVAFYQMDDKSGEWTKRKDVAFKAPLKLISNMESTLTFEGIDFELKAKIYNHHSVIQFNDACWGWVFKHFATHPELYAILEKIDEEAQTAQMTVDPDIFMDMVIPIMMEEKKAEMIRERERQIAEAEQKQKEWEEKERLRIEAEEAKLDAMRTENERFANTLQAEGNNQIQANPALVEGLRSSDFGVYNCDQIYQMKKPMVLSPTYVDENGTKITNKHVACVMDLNFNGSFNFHPNNITCNGAGKNVILLFTDNKDVFMLSEEKFNQLDITSNFRPVFEMKNMTGVIKTSDDLKKYLKI